MKFTEIREGQVWRRKRTLFLWRIEAINPNETVSLKIEQTGTDDREMMTVADFKEKFQDPAEPIFFHDNNRSSFSCPACEGDITIPHQADCAYANGN